MIGHVKDAGDGSITSLIPLQQLIERMKSLHGLVSQNSYIKDTTNRLKRIIDDASTPITILLLGKERVGKTTVINALLGREALSVSKAHSTSVNTFIRFGEQECIRAVFLDGMVATFDLDKMELLTTTDVEGSRMIREYIDYIEVYINHDFLKNVTFIDSVALEMLNDEMAYFSELLVERADEIFWVVRNGEEATYAELALLEKYNQRHIKPRFIFNATDEADAAGFMAAESIRYGSKTSSMNAVSARRALEAARRQDLQMLEESGCLELLELIASISENHGKKTKHAVDRLIHWLGCFHQEIEQIKKREPYRSAHESLKKYEGEEDFEYTRQQRDMALLKAYQQECQQVCSVFKSVETLYQLLQKLTSEPYLRDEQIEEFEYYALHYQQSVRDYRKLHVEYMQVYGVLDTQHRKAFGKGIEKGNPAQYADNMSVMRQKRHLDQLQAKCEALHHTIKRHEDLVLEKLYSTQNHLAELAQKRLSGIIRQVEELNAQRKREKNEVKSSVDKILEFSCLEDAQTFIQEAIKPYLLNGAFELSTSQRASIEHIIDRIARVDLSNEEVALLPGHAEDLKLQAEFDAGFTIIPLRLTEADVVSDIPEPPVPLHV
ncbi:MAG: GTPase [Lysinibacillus sp.]